MKRGPKPKPTTLRVLEGNRGKRPLNKSEPKPKLGQPKCPVILKGEARKEWRRVVPELHKLGLIALIDRASLIILCLSWGEYSDAQAIIDAPEFQAITISNHGTPNVSPWFRIRDSAFNRYVKAAANFGLSPADRTRLQIPTPTEKPDTGKPKLAHERK